MLFEFSTATRRHLYFGKHQNDFYSTQDVRISNFQMNVLATTFKLISAKKWNMDI